MALEPGIVDPGAVEAIGSRVAEQRGPGTIVGLRRGSGGASADGDNRQPVCKIGRRIGASETQGILVDVNLRRHTRDLGTLHTGNTSISPDLIVVHLKNNSPALYRFEDRVVNPQGDFKKHQRNDDTNQQRSKIKY